MVYPRRCGLRRELGTSVYHTGMGRVSRRQLGMETTAFHSVSIFPSSWGNPRRRCRMVTGVLELESLAGMVPKSHTELQRIDLFSWTFLTSPTLPT